MTNRGQDGRFAEEGETVTILRDKNGRKTEEIYRNENGILSTSVQYDENGNPRKATVFQDDGKNPFRTFTYSASGEKESEEHFDENGKCTNISIFQGNKRVNEIMYMSDTTVIKFFEDNNQTLSVYLDQNGNPFCTESYRNGQTQTAVFFNENSDIPSHAIYYDKDGKEKGVLQLDASGKTVRTLKQAGDEFVETKLEGDERKAAEIAQKQATILAQITQKAKRIEQAQASLSAMTARSQTAEQPQATEQPQTAEQTQEKENPNDSGIKNITVHQYDEQDYARADARIQAFVSRGIITQEEVSQALANIQQLEDAGKIPTGLSADEKSTRSNASIYLYKALQARGLYHPDEPVYTVQNGKMTTQKSGTVSEVLEGSPRDLIKDLTSNDISETGLSDKVAKQLSATENAISEKGHAVLGVKVKHGGKTYMPGRDIGYKSADLLIKQDGSIEQPQAQADKDERKSERTAAEPPAPPKLGNGVNASQNATSEHSASNTTAHSDGLAVSEPAIPGKDSVGSSIAKQYESLFTQSSQQGNNTQISAPNIINACSNQQGLA